MPAGVRVCSGCDDDSGAGEDDGDVVDRSNCSGNDGYQQLLNLSLSTN